MRTELIANAMIGSKEYRGRAQRFGDIPVLTFGKPERNLFEVIYASARFYQCTVVVLFRMY